MASMPGTMRMRVVIAEHAIDRAAEMRAQPRQPLERRVIGAIGVRRDSRRSARRGRSWRSRTSAPPRCMAAGLRSDMQVAQMQDGEAVEQRRQLAKPIRTSRSSTRSALRRPRP